MTFLYDFLNQIDCLLHLCLALFDGFAVILNIVQLTGDFLDVVFAGGEHFVVNFGVFLVADTLKQDFLLVGFALLKVSLKLFDFAGDGAFSLQPSAYVVINIFVILHCLFADIQNFIIDKLVNFALVDSMRGAIFLAVAVVAVAGVFDSQRFITPFALDSYEGRSAVAAFKQSGIAVAGLTCARSDVAFFFCSIIFWTNSNFSFEMIGVTKFS